MIFDDISITPHQKNFVLSAFLDRLREKNRQLSQEKNKWFTKGLLEWSGYFLRDHFQKTPSGMHDWLAGQLDHFGSGKGFKLNLLAPRGAAKSTLGALAFPLRIALENQEPYIWIVSDTMSQAHSHLENIKCELTANRLVAKYYPYAAGKGTIWRNGSIVMNNGVMIEAFGTGQRLRGRRRRQSRPGLIICDDLQGDQHIVSSFARDKSRSWFHGTLLKAGTTSTTVLNLATALHNEAIAIELFNKPGWVSKRFQAIEHWPKNMSLWEEWERIYTSVDDTESVSKADLFYDTNRVLMDEDAVVLWPQHENLHTLMKMRTESGRTAFEREKQNSPVNPDYCEWPESYFDETIWFEQIGKDIVCTIMCLDPSKGKDAARGDYSAFVIVSYTNDGVFYVDADLARRSVPDILAQGVELYKRHHPDLFAVESNQFQDLLQSDFEKEFAAQQMHYVRPYPLENHTNKLVRIRRLGPILSMKRLKFRQDSPSTKLLVEQLKMFPVGDHDDGPDALEMAVRLIKEWTKQVPINDGLGNRFHV